MEFTLALAFGLMGVFIVIILFLVYLWNNLRLKIKDAALYQAKYPPHYQCLDGHIVRTLSECLIDDFFYRHNIEHRYEDVILKNADKQYKYDWYLPEVELYVEFFGFSGKKYKETQADKIKFYRFHQLKMIPLDPMDLEKVEETLPVKFASVWKKIATDRHCPHCGKTLDNRV